MLDRGRSGSGFWRKNAVRRLFYNTLAVVFFFSGLFEFSVLVGGQVTQFSTRKLMSLGVVFWALAVERAVASCRRLRTTGYSEDYRYQLFLCISCIVGLAVSFMGLLVPWLSTVAQAANVLVCIGLGMWVVCVSWGLD